MQAILRTLRHFFTPQTCLPTAEETGLFAQTTEEANKAVEDVLKPQRWHLQVKTARRESIQQVLLLKIGVTYM